MEASGEGGGGYFNLFLKTKDECSINESHEPHNEFCVLENIKKNEKYSCNKKKLVYSNI